MKIDPFWFHLVVVLVVAGAGYAMHMRTLRLRSCYNMYRVRDSLVLLVARDVLPESSEVFKHYYGSINRLLSDAPRVGLDDVLSVIFKANGQEFERAVEIARQRAKRMSGDPLLQNDEVRRVVSDYFVALRSMMLSHSSFLKLAYVVSRHLVAPVLAKRLGKVVPRRIERGLRAVDYAEFEAAEFRPT